MREIKFRAWLVREEVMVYSVEEPERFSIDKLGNICVSVEGDTLYSPRIVPMQYTGLKDKNGKEIYEGDIVINNEYPKHPAVVKYEVKEPCKDEEFTDPLFGGKTNLNGYISEVGSFVFEHLTERRVAMYVQNLEIIGDIYSTPNLLTK